jgi:hypothetical protein
MKMKYFGTDHFIYPPSCGESREERKDGSKEISLHVGKRDGALREGFGE